MKALLIAEKPSLMREIKAVYDKHKSAYGMDIDFTAQAGHLVGLKLPSEIDEKYAKWRLDNFPIDVDYIYKVLPGKYDLINSIKKAVKSGDYDCVIHAGDPDGEGELLVNLVLQHVGNKLPVKRFWTNDLTEGAIDHALKNLTDDKDYRPVFDAALTRQHLDYQFGMNVTGVATLRSGKTLKLGRVKAPIINLIVQREREIENFVDSSKFMEAFLYKDCEFVGETEYADQNAANMALIKTDAALVTAVSEKDTVKKAPKLFKLSTLQSEAHSKFKMNGAAVLATVQSLYEKKLVSYPRTDCEYISSHTNVKPILSSLTGMFGISMGDLQDTSKIMSDGTYANDKKIASEGHTGLIPTGKIPSGLTPAEQKIYDLIARRFLAIFGQPKKIHSITVEAEAEGKKFTYQDREDVFAGYETILDPGYKLKTMPKISYKKGETIRPIEPFVKEIKAKPPARYNDGSLIKALDTPEGYKDENGKEVKYKIGTPATRSNIIEDCIKCGYFNRDNKGVYTPTELAFYTVDTYGDLMLFDITTSAKWEEAFEHIRAKEKSAADVESSVMGEMRSIVADIKGRDVKRVAYDGSVVGGHKKSRSGSLDLPCPCCQNGKITKNSKAYSCSNWNAQDKCNFTIWQKSKLGYKVSDADVKKLVSGKTIKKKCTSAAGKTWEQELYFDKNTGKVEFVQRETGYER